jgi:hypothetical protein
MEEKVTLCDEGNTGVILPSKTHWSRSYLLVANRRVASALAVDSHECISQTLDGDCNLDKVVERDIAAA